MAQGADTKGRNGFVPQRAWWATQRRQCPVATGEACAGRRRELPVAEVEAGVAARPEAQRGDGAAAGGRRLLRDRAVALPINGSERAEPPSIPPPPPRRR